MRDYARKERNARLAEALSGDLSQAEQAERRERFAGIVRIERGPAAYRVTFPRLSVVEKGTPEAREAWDQARLPMQDVKSIPGRKWDAVQGAWIIPLSEAGSVEYLASEYGAEIEELALAAGFSAEAAARIRELEEQLAIRERYIEGLEQELEQHAECKVA